MLAFLLVVYRPHTSTPTARILMVFRVSVGGVLFGRAWNVKIGERLKVNFRAHSTWFNRKIKRLV